jgi:hypothetical protein
MIRWLKNLLGPKAPPPDPRQILAEAISEIGDPSLVPKAMELYDSPEAFDAYMYEAHLEPPWVSDDRAPRPGELGYEILWTVLEQNGRAGFIDWATGVIGILDTFDELFVKAGVARFSVEQRTELERLHEHAERGKAFRALFKTLDRAAQERGLEVTYRSLDHDAHYPVLLTPAAYKRWDNAMFAKGLPVI